MKRKIVTEILVPLLLRKWKKWKGHCAIKREVRSLQVQAEKHGRLCLNGQDGAEILPGYVEHKQPWRPLPISSVPVNTRRKHSELKLSFFSDTAHHRGTFKAVPVGSSERAGKSPSKMGALPLPWADWHQLPYTALCWARERKGGDHGNETDSDFSPSVSIWGYGSPA